MGYYVIGRPYPVNGYGIWDTDMGYGYGMGYGIIITFYGKRNTDAKIHVLF
jgi:hypothetical protein